MIAVPCCFGPLLRDWSRVIMCGRSSLFTFRLPETESENVESLNVLFKGIPSGD